jgi:hypothetical protein
LKKLDLLKLQVVLTSLIYRFLMTTLIAARWVQECALKEESLLLKKLLNV